MRLPLFHTLAAVLAALTATAPGQLVFRTPELLTDGTARYQMPRNPNGALQADASGNLHLVYWAGGEFTTVAAPSYVYYQRRSAGVWGGRETIDNSTYDTGSGIVQYGGRQPNMALSPDGTVNVVWHDHRHSTVGAPGNGQDNIEIYMDSRPAAGSFSATDVRLTTTSAGTVGDNGFLPRIAAGPGARLTVAWYDFHFAEQSEIMVKRSDAAGVFNTAESMTAMRLTDDTVRPSTDSFSTPDIAVDTTGAVHAVWGRGFGVVTPLHYAVVASPLAVPTITTLSADASGYFDPARLTAAPNGDVWVVYTYNPAVNRDIRARRLRAGQTAFDAVIEFKATAVEEYGADLEVDADGLLHLVWVDERAGRQVYYGLYDPAGPGFLQEVALTDRDASWQRPTVALTAAGVPHVVWEEEVGFTSGALWYTTPESALAARNWELYQ